MLAESLRSGYSEDDDWRSQLDTKYSGSEYNELMSTSGLNRLESSDMYGDVGEGRRVVDAFRFPPVPAVALPGEVLKRDYEQNFDLRSAFDSLHASAEEGESVAALDFLESMLQTVIEKCVDTRGALLENGEYIYSLQSPPSGEEMEYMKSVVMENLGTLREESLQLMGEMESFDAGGVGEMILSGDGDMGMVIHQLKQSLLDRSATLKQEVASTLIALDGLTLFSSSVINIPPEKICRMDGVYVDWAGAVKMQEQVSCCTRSFNFSEYMSAMGFPVCTQIFAYLQSTDAYGGALVVCGYAFKSGELKAVLAFFDAHDQRAQARTPFISIYQSIRSLVVQRCELSDRDCHTLCSRISHMTGLVSLNLRENRLTYSGAASLASALYEHSTRMRILRLDGNNIKADGALVVAQVLHKMPFLEVLSLSQNPIRDKGLFYLFKYSLNPHRAAYARLHKPARSLGDKNKVEIFEGEEVFLGDSDVEDEGDPIDDDPFLTDNLESRERRAFRRKIMKRCYFDDYFRFHYSFAKGRVSVEEDEEEAAARVRREKEQWVNQEEDEFYVEARSDYSDSEAEEESVSGESVSLGGGGSSMRRDSQVGDGSQDPQEVHLARLAVARLRVYADAPRLVQLLLKLRVKLLAVGAFMRLLRTGSMLSSLSVADCGLTMEGVTTVQQALAENQNIVHFDASNNSEFLRSFPSCQKMAQLIQVSALRTLLLNNCGISDRGFMAITTAAAIAPYLRNLELSGNRIGPTGLNWAGTTSKVFFMDKLDLGGGFKSSAPFKRKGDPSLASVFDESEKRVARTGEVGERVEKEEGEEDSVGTYQDTDLFEGEEEEDDYEQDEEGEQESDEDSYGTYASHSHPDYPPDSPSLNEGAYEAAEPEDESVSAVRSRIGIL
ncbi:hypothetical protein B484DRAFT_452422 [Ochromonadaceae sp. CCMP2298]|nr:hypothetical protein B484DRAFT_452422 [Ochromonadaceae sp. CCMP2298]